MSDERRDALAYFNNYDAQYGVLVDDPHREGVAREWMRAARVSKNVHLIAEAARSVKRAEAAEAVAESVIPPGIYCYSKTEPLPDGGTRLLDLCPYWSRRSDKPEQENGYCAYLGAGDWEEDGCGLLWDQVKECGVNEDE